MRRGLSNLLLLVSFALCGAVLHASEPADDWQALPIWGGDVRSLAVAPDDPDTVLAGTSAGQLYLSRNGGQSWAPAGTPVALPGWVIGHLEFDPNRPTRLWAALRGVWSGGHVASSDDLGRTWSTRANGLPDQPVYTLALAPGRPGRVYAATSGGVFGSDDDGASWHPLTAELPEVEKVTSLWVDPAQPDRIIAGTWRRAYRSEDGGKTWTGVFTGMVLDTEVFSMVSRPGPEESGGEVWASTCGWVYRSTDRGTSWTRFQEGFVERRTPSFAALPSGRLLAGTVAGLHVSDDSGKSFHRVGDPAIAIQAIAYHPQRPDRIYFATEGSGVWVSQDGGTSLYPSNPGITNVRISSLAAVGGELLIGVSQAGPFSGMYHSLDGGKTFPDGFTSLPTILDLAPQGKRLFAATERGLFERRGAGWHWLRDLGETRVEQLTGEGRRLAARTDSKLFELSGKIFVERPFRHGPPRSALYVGDALWVTDAQGLYRLAGATNHTLETPFAGGRISRVGDRIVYWGTGGAFARTAHDASTAGDAGWREVSREPSRVLPTGDARLPALLLSGETARLFQGEGDALEALTLPIPARDVSTALILDGRLYLGTSGYGVLVRGLTP
jgi:photosystem II stability/assembly factor-like uncharacterized protein